MRILVVGGSPLQTSPDLLRSIYAACDAVVAVDRGLDALVRAGLSCDLFCGDADSVSRDGASLVREVESDGCRLFSVVRYDPHKDATDLELALGEVRRRWGDADIVATSLSGGMPDHFLAALGRLLAWTGSVELVEDAFVGRLLHVGDIWDLSAYHGRRFSFVPLSPHAVVSERGMRWNLDHRCAELFSDLGIANELDGPDALIECHEGSLGAWVYLCS